MHRPDVSVEPLKIGYMIQYGTNSRFSDSNKNIHF